MANGVELATAYVSLVGETAKLKKDISAAFEEADKSSLRAGKKIGQNLSSGLDGTKSSAAKAGSDAAAAYEKSLKSQIRGEKLGEAIGRPIGKGLGIGLKVGMAGAAAAAGAGVALLGTALTKGFKRLRDIDTAKFKLQALGNTAGDVNKIMDSALAAVKGTSFGMEEAATTAATAVAAGVGTGEELTKYLTNAADAAAIAGTSLEEMGSIFNKIQTSNKAFTDDLRQLSDRGLPVFTWLQKEYGVTAEALTKMVSDGQVDAATFNRVISENIGGAAQKMGDSFEGAVSKANSALGRIGASLINSALGGTGLEGPTAGINNMTEALDKLDAAVKDNEGGIISFFGEVMDFAAGATRMTLNFAAETVGAIAVIYNAIADLFGGMAKAGSWLAGVLGNDEMAKDWGAWSEELFGAADGLYEVKQNLKDSAVTVDDFGNRFKAQMDKNADAVNKVKAVTKAMGDSFKAVNDQGQIILETNALEKVDELNALELVITTLPDGSFAIAPGTPQAQALIDAFVAKNSTLPKATVPIDVDTSAAQQKLQALYNDIFKAPANFTPPPASSGAPPILAGIPNSGYVPYDPALNRRPSFGGGRASGGPIGGSGPKGKDSTLIMAAPGEHMLTASEVDALGGQSGAYALRAAIRAGTIPGFENGGAIGGGDPRVKAIDTAFSKSGKPYNYGAWDCSMYLSHAYAGMTGQPPGRYFTTESDFEALGFKRGYKPGALNVGIRRGGGGKNSHMAGTLPNGVNIENSSNGSIYGDGAAGASDFPLQYYYEPPNAGDLGEMQAQGVQGGSGASNAPGMAATGGKPVDGASGGMGVTGPARTEGYIPAAAGASGTAGNSFASGLIDMGAEAINGLIDQAASAASGAASMGANAIAPGSGGAAAAGIGIGTSAAKRGVQWGADMLGIGIDSVAEIFSPFGVPRFFETDPTGFMPNFDITPAATTTAETLGIDPSTTEHGQGAGRAPGPVAPQANLTAPNPEDLHAQPPGIQIGEISGMNPDDVGDQLMRLQRLNAMQYQGRP